MDFATGYDGIYLPLSEDIAGLDVEESKKGHNREPHHPGTDVLKHFDRSQLDSTGAQNATQNCVLPDKLALRHTLRMTFAEVIIFAPPTANLLPPDARGDRDSFIPTAVCLAARPVEVGWTALGRRPRGFPTADLRPRMWRPHIDVFDKRWTNMCATDATRSVERHGGGLVDSICVTKPNTQHISRVLHHPYEL
jgi:hypothetical protein